MDPGSAPHHSVLRCARDDMKSMHRALGLSHAVDRFDRIRPPFDENDPVVVHCDKLGGRNYYAALLQHAFPAEGSMDRVGPYMADFQRLR